MRVELTGATNQTLINFAHAFDGYAYAKSVWHAAENAEQEVLLERLNQAQSSGRFYLEASDNFAINFYLHRGFYNLGSLPEPGSPDWLDMVFLYLHLYRLPIPAKYRHGLHADWARRPKGSAEDAAAEIRNTLRLRLVSASPRVPLEPNVPVSAESGNLKALMSVLDDVQVGIKNGSARLFRDWALGETSGPSIQSALEMAGDNEDWQSISVCCVVITAIHKATEATPGIDSAAEESPTMSTLIPYCLQSQFFEPIEATIRAVGGAVASPLHVTLKRGGYSQDCHVLISQSDGTHFQTDWKNKDPTRFSARCRAAATVLHRNGHEGRFRIRHVDGALTIVPS